MRWRPLSVRSQAISEDEYDALHDGMPPWLAAGVINWVAIVVQSPPVGNTMSVVLELEQVLRTPLLLQSNGRSPVDAVLEAFGSSDEQALDIVDALLVLSSGWSRSSQYREHLDTMLTRGGSAWKVAKDEAGRPCLQRRVDEATEAAAKDAMSRPGNAARYLRAAWHKVYGRDPDPGGGYRDAVRAVEAAAKPVVTPNDPVATLGKMIAAIRAKPSKWTSELGTMPVVADMMGTLHKSQLDRHGTDDESVPLSVSPAQAEAAVHLAVTLVHWFQTGAVRLV